MLDADVVALNSMLRVRVGDGVGRGCSVSVREVAADFDGLEVPSTVLDGVHGSETVFDITDESVIDLVTVADRLLELSIVGERVCV